MKTAIWAAVSTVSQAGPDKVSIQVQVTKGREFIASRGYQPAGEYIAPGESRTRYISLYHAEREIEPLHQLLEAASRKEFDLLFVYDLNRFRSLMRQVFDALTDYNIQLYIHTNPREPIPPSQYNDEHKTAAGMIVDLSNIISRSEISSLQRHFQEKMPGRIHKGLDARLGSIPYGYKRIHPADKDNPLVIDPATARIVRQMADWYISGASLKEIAKRLNEKNIPSSAGRAWHPESVRIILASPFYAGIVYFGRTKYKLDRRSGKETRTRNPSPAIGKGKHEPLWDQETHLRILELIDQRGRGFRGNKTTRLSRLLYCFCGSKLHYDRSGSSRPFWRCSSKQRGHTFIMDDRALELVIPAIVEQLRTQPNLTAPQPARDPTETILTDLRSLEQRKTKLLDLYELATDQNVSPESILKRIKPIDEEIAELSARLQLEQLLTVKRQTAQTTRARLTELLDSLPDYYLNAPPTQVNADLHTIIKKITISKTHEITIDWG